MEKILNNLYVGSDEDYLKVKDRDDFSILRCCKSGPGSHRELLGYSTQAAPKGDNYLTVRKNNVMALNFIDPHDPHFIPVDMVKEGLKFIDEELAKGKKVLIACNAGHSRGPTTAMLYLRAIGEFAHNFISTENVFRTLYPNYDPGVGARTFARSNWHEFKDILRGK